MEYLLALAGGLSGGIFLRAILISGWAVPLFALAIGFLLAAAAYRLPHLRKPLILAALALASLALGYLRFAVSDTAAPTAFTASLGHRVSYSAVVVGEASLRDASERVPLRVSANGATTYMLAVAPRSETVMVGDRVRVSGTLDMPQAFEDDNGRTFRYDRYLAKDGIRFMLDFASLSVSAHAPWYSPTALLTRAKAAFVRGIDNALPEPYASLASGILVGGKSGLGTTLTDAFTKSGLVQIIVLSGYNIMVVAEWVMVAFAFLKMPRRASALAGALALILFVGIAGASATAVRAALMALTALYARATGRSYAASRALLAAIVLMLLWNPFYLAFDPGFALSVAATAGLIWLAPLFERFLGAWLNAFWKNTVATTLAAQIAVLPLLLYFTGNLSFVAIPANLLVLWMVPAAMLVSAIAAVAGMFFGIGLFASIVALPAYFATGYLILVAQKSAALPWAALSIPPFPFLLVVVAYGALIYFAASSKRFSTTLQFTFARKAST